MKNATTQKVLLVGGGTGGHIYPLKNLAEELLDQKTKVELVVADQDLDKKIVQEEFKNIKTYYLKSGKVRRYFSWQSLKDFFLIFSGIYQARKILKESKPNIIFLKGGFIGFPILIAAKFLFCFKGKIYSHESDIIPGLMTKIAAKFSHKSFQSFADPAYPLFYTEEFKNKKSDQETSPDPLPQILIFGGSQGALFINQLIENILPQLIKKYKIILITGLNKQINFTDKNFTQDELVPVKELSEKITQSNLIITRGGANSLFEIIEAKKPSIIIPLPSAAQNHQYLNAQFFAKKNLAICFEQDRTTPEKLLNLIDQTINNKILQKALKNSDIQNQAKNIATKILES